MTPTEYSEQIEEILNRHAQEFRAGHLDAIHTAILNATRELIDGTLNTDLPKGVDRTCARLISQRLHNALGGK